VPGSGMVLDATDFGVAGKGIGLHRTLPSQWRT